MKIRRKKKQLYHHLKNMGSGHLDYFEAWADIHISTFNHPRNNIDRFTAGIDSKLIKFDIPEEQFLSDGFYYSMDKDLLDKLEERGLEVERITTATDDSNIVLARIDGDVSDKYRDSRYIIFEMLNRAFVGSIGPKIRNSSISGHHAPSPYALKIKYVKENIIPTEHNVAMRGFMVEGCLVPTSFDLVNSKG